MTEDVGPYLALEDDIHGNDTEVTVYVLDKDWTPARRVAFENDLTISTIVRRGFRGILAV